MYTNETRELLMPDSIQSVLNDPFINIGIEDTCLQESSENY